ncbi:enolase C-terminal domain-like protein [Chelativorans sp.]|uniref:enolase C-terminal domain-like protein n=1 Tax=Chelativorans sp. TaxID=2203393 RepID=UPI00281228A1|nr:enolase C-terminal domain-like protein [Chelativorans sp.]
MRIADVRLLLPADCSYFTDSAASEDIAQRGWVTRLQVANPMSTYPQYAMSRRSWMGPGQEHYAIEIETDTGEVGVCANYYGGAMACEIIRAHFRRFLLGQDPFDSAKIWDQMYRASLPYGHGGLIGMAIAGVDLALWDLKGKLLGQPVYKLLGGATKDDGIPCYLTTHSDAVGHWRDSGFLGVKIAAPFGAESGRAGVLKMEKLIRELRETIGPDKEIMIDCYMSWGHEFALAVAERVKNCGVKWFEDPLPSGWAADANRDLRKALVPIGLANGNMEFDHHAFAGLLEAGASSVIQPEIHWCGGLTAVLRIAAYAEHHHVPLVPHGPNIYPMHLVMANAGSPYAEFVTGGDGTTLVNIFDLLLDQPLPVEGRYHLPDTPGFGVRLNHDRLRKYPS